MPSLSRSEIIGAAALLTAPVLVAAVWDRISAVKVAGVEVSLAIVTRRPEENLSRELEDTSKAVLGDDTTSAIKVAVRTTSPLIQVNLRDGKFWWSTRLYLLSALALDYTTIRYLVFVEECDGEENCYVGMATPLAVKSAVKTRVPALDSQYHKVRGDESLPRCDAEQEVNDVLAKLHTAMAPPAMNERAMMQPVSSAELRSWLGPNLVRVAIDWHGPDDALFRYQIVDAGTPFVAIVCGRKLRRVIDRCELATLTAKEALAMMIRRY